MVLLEKENTNLKQTLVLEKRHIDELDVKFKEFVSVLRACISGFINRWFQ